MEIASGKNAPRNDEMAERKGEWFMVKWFMEEWEIVNGKQEMGKANREWFMDE